MKHYVIALFLGMTLLLGGCGTKQAIDTYSFGQKVINVGQSEVIVDSPFDFGKLEKVVANEKGQPLDLYAGLDANYGIYVMATQGSVGAPLLSIEQAAKSYQAQLAQEVSVPASQLKWTEETVTVDGVKAVKSMADVPVNAGRVSFTQYTFINRGVLWNIRYSYNETSPMGAEINDRVDGHIQITKKEG